MLTTCHAHSQPCHGQTFLLPNVALCQFSPCNYDYQMTDGTRIVEVNGVNVNQENHKQVVARIKSIENETKLLGIVQKFACCNAFYVSFSCESNPNNC